MALALWDSEEISDRDTAVAPGAPPSSTNPDSDLPKRSKRRKLSPQRTDPMRFKTKLCSSWMEEGACPYEGECQFAHGKQDLRSPLFDDDKVKTKLCEQWSTYGTCSYEHVCRFAHGEHELRSLTLGGRPSRRKEGGKKSAASGRPKVGKDGLELCRDWLRGGCDRQPCKFSHSTRNKAEGPHRTSRRPPAPAPAPLPGPTPGGPIPHLAAPPPPLPSADHPAALLSLLAQLGHLVFPSPAFPSSSGGPPAALLPAPPPPPSGYGPSPAGYGATPAPAGVVDSFAL